ncbi:hypothetical protein ACVIW0_004323 [Bradyrhizobium sp. USDA 4454]
MGYGLYVLSPARLGFVVTVFATRIAQSEKTPTARASGLHDFAVRLACSRQATRSVHRISTRVRDDREAPLVSGETDALNI